MDLALSTNDAYCEDNESAAKENCRRCCKPTQLMCMRCGDYYCSKRCQEIDWSKHRYICFPKPPLVKLHSLPDGDKMPEFGVIEPVHLKEQLRIMANVCLDFMKHLDVKHDAQSSNRIDNGNANCSNECSNAANSKALNSNVPKAQQEIEATTYKNGIVVSEKNSSATTTTELVKSDEQIVKITGFRSSNRVALCPEKYFEKLDYVLRYINKCGQNAPPLNSTPQVDTFVLTHCKFGTYIRAKVLQPKFADKIRLECVDYGNVCHRRLHELRQIPSELAEMAVYTQIFSLHGVQLYDFKHPAHKFLAAYEGKICKMLKVPFHPQNKDCFEVMLFDRKAGETINKQIEQIFQTKNVAVEICNNNIANNIRTQTTNNDNQSKEHVDNSTEQPNLNQQTSNGNALNPKNFVAKNDTVSIKHVLIPPFNQHLFSKDIRNVKAVILDTSAAQDGYIACILQENMIILKQIQSYLDDKTKISDEPYQPVLNEYVLAKFEGDWYRGKVCQVDAKGKKFDISFIDFLNVSTITSADIRRYPIDLTIDCYTTLCVIDGLPEEMSDELKEFLCNTLVAFEVISIDRVISYIDERVAIVQCGDLLNKIKSNNLI